MRLSVSKTGWDKFGAGDLKAALKNTTLVDAGWLLSLAERGVVIPRCQDVPDKAKVTLTQMEAWGDQTTLAVLVISSPWLDENHPDPKGETIKKLLFVLYAFAAHAQTYEGCKVGVLWNYLSVPQTDRKGTDDRTHAEKKMFKLGMNSIHSWFSHPMTYVLLVNDSLPTAHAYANTQP